MIVAFQCVKLDFVVVKNKVSISGIFIRDDMCVINAMFYQQILKCHHALNNQQVSRVLTTRQISLQI